MPKHDDIVPAELQRLISDRMEEAKNDGINFAEIVNKVNDLEEKVKEVHNQAFVDEDGYLAVKCCHCNQSHRIMLWDNEIKVRESESYKFCIQTVST